MFLANQSKNCDVKEKDSKNEHDNVNDDDEGCSFVTLLVDKVEEKSHENHANWNKENWESCWSGHDDDGCNSKSDEGLDSVEDDLSGWFLLTNSDNCFSLEISCFNSSYIHNNNPSSFNLSQKSWILN